MFLQASVILLTGGRRYLPPGTRHPPQSRPPVSRHPPEQTPPRADTPPGSRPPHPREQTLPTPGSRHPPQSRPPPQRACCEIRSTRGQYASYWNAILLSILLVSYVFTLKLILKLNKNAFQ